MYLNYSVDLLSLFLEPGFVQIFKNVYHFIMISSSLASTQIEIFVFSIIFYTSEPTVFERDLYNLYGE
jgi:hypothetical protein